MGKREERVNAYIARSADFAKPILVHLREIMHATCPEVEETWKWSFPVFVYKGAIMCNMAAFKEHCSFGFWKASLMTDTDKLFDLQERDGMGHFGKIYSLKDLPKDTILKKYIKAAMKLNEDGVKLPPRAKVTEEKKKELEVPDYFIAELKKNIQTHKAFDAFSYSCKKEYVQWFEDAKTDVTRNKRITQALEWIAEGKDRNWKYKNC